MAAEDLLPPKKGKKNKKKKLGPYYYYEIIDRTAIIAANVNDYLLQHPAVEQNKKLYKTVEKISELFGQLYQDIGNMPDYND